MCVDKTKKFLSSEFSMKDMGEVDVILSIQIKRDHYRNSIMKIVLLNPSRQHWYAITRVFKYLKGTMNYVLSYVGYPLVLEGYSDASGINHVEDLSSTSGCVFLLGGGAISWASKKQNG
uniref:Zinc finger, CCHC-type n=1 Tax=Tanacetum cinerariifolium TaxID=118510 RepID=A0A699U5U0_TANCI|nr:zinc finger, CCHC-type [Tanacetum cinerariifolium]